MSGNPEMTPVIIQKMGCVANWKTVAIIMELIGSNAILKFIDSVVFITLLG